MRKVVLTVLKNNQNSLFFKKLKYVESNHVKTSFYIFFRIIFSYKIDEYSPEDDEEETYCYEILSKFNRKFAPPPQPVANTTNKPQSIADHMRCCSGHHHHHH